MVFVVLILVLVVVGVIIGIQYGNDHGPYGRQSLGSSDPLESVAYVRLFCASCGSCVAAGPDMPHTLAMFAEMQRAGIECNECGSGTMVVKR